MNNIARRIATGLVLVTAPIMIALGTATISHADVAPANSSVSHPVFPNQTNMPVPGAAIHHHHQNNK
jgi:hypothetical protein